MSQDWRETFINEKSKEGLSPFEALEALADEAHDRGDHWTGMNARMAALDFIRPKDCAIGRF